MRTLQTAFWFALGAPLLLAGGTSVAGPAEAPPVDEGEESDRPQTTSVPSLMSELEQNMQILGEMAQDAKADNDAVRAACVQDKLERGQAVMEVATGELMVLRDPNSTSQQKAFAVEKLQEASARLGRVVEDARRCRGEEGPEDEDDVTRNEIDEPVTVPIADPTQVGGDPPVPPPVDDHRPPTVASPSE